MSKILVLEDDESIRKLITVNLTRDSFEVFEAGTGERALEIFEEIPDIDIAILDVMLPGIDGLTVCQQLRERHATLGIMMLTAKSQEVDKVLGLDHGADDYLTKPFSPLELMARIKALYRRVRVNETKYIEEVIKSGVFELNVNTRQCFKSALEIVLTPTEFMMLKYFIESEDQTLSREDLLKHIWGENFYGDMKIVDVNIRRLRRKIEDDPSTPTYIETVWGRGYKWKREGYAEKDKY
jgi:DNA-binding response OmpR family regulator